MSEEEGKEVRLEDEQEKVLTLKISLEGPAEVLSWIRDNSPMRMGERVADRFSGGFMHHMRAAQREQLLAVRSLLDGMIGRLEERDKPERKARTVEIE